MQEQGIKQGIETISLNIEGMNSSHEVSLIKKKLDSLAGIESYDVDTVSKQINVFYDPAQVTVQDIIRSIPETGMNASLVQGRLMVPSHQSVSRVTSSFTKYLSLGERPVNFPV